MIIIVKNFAWRGFIFNGKIINNMCLGWSKYYFIVNLGNNYISAT